MCCVVLCCDVMCCVVLCCVVLCCVVLCCVVLCCVLCCVVLCCCVVLDVSRCLLARLPVTRVKSGWLKKEGGSWKSWKNRFFCTEGTKLKYYEKEKVWIEFVLCYVLCSLFSVSVHCLLFIVHCSLFCSLFTIHCSLFTVHYSLFIVHCSLLISPLEETGGDGVVMHVALVLIILILKFSFSLNRTKTQRELSTWRQRVTFKHARCQSIKESQHSKSKLRREHIIWCQKLEHNVIHGLRL